ncbi:phosphatase PAP2 family protein [Polaromonas jejuensis]|uniref:Phosphatase PAP2 family protein n=1 Tax=Polaromonas jejuensis TaxID=457502 RepID=A0ABW0Q749_9BURK|nr:phosphatase PAP2 family protein [Polaromonas jejuensis]
MNHIETLNRAFFLKINAGPGTAAWIIDRAALVADDLIYLIPVLLVGLWLWGREGRRNLALRAALVAMLGIGLNQLIGLAWPHPRPFAIGLGHTWIAHAADSSFPSDHMTVFSSIGISLLLGGEVWFGVLTLAAALCVGWARVFLGVHYPLDMLGAIGVALFAHAVIARPWRSGGPRLTLFVEKIYWRLLALPIQQGWLRR